MTGNEHEIGLAFDDETQLALLHMTGLGRCIDCEDIVPILLKDRALC